MTAALLYSLVYAGAIAPGVILGRRLAGGGQPAGWIIGGVLGYGTTQLSLWLPIFLHAPSPLAFVGAWGIQAAILCWLARRIEAPVLRLPPRSRHEGTAIALTLAIAAVVMLVPYRNLGRADESGTRYYRAYFTADFFWHTALAAELGRYTTPPRDPYMASREMNYYWTYFLLPAVVAHEAPAPLDDVQRDLKVNASLSALLVVGMLYVFVRTGVPSPAVAATAVIAGLLAASAEGSLVLLQLWRAGKSIAAVKDLNIDAISNWQLGGLRIDGLPRGLWYNPQHSLACALGLVAAVAATGGARLATPAVWLAGMALGLSICFNPFVGALFCVIYGISVVVDGARTRSLTSTIGRHALTLMPVAAALAWCVVNKVAGGAAGAVLLGFRDYAAHNTVRALLLSTGPVLLPALGGLWRWRSLPAQPAIVAAAGTVVSLLVMHLVTISEGSWVGFRTGQILLLMLPLLLGRLLYAVASRRGVAIAVTVLCLLAGLPTTVIDAYNAQDIGNRAPGPGFRWTIPVTAPQQAAFSWIRRNVPEDAVVQMEPVVRGRDHWSLVPSFAQRRMSAGLPISLLPVPAYAEGSAEVQRLYATVDASEAHRLALSRRIQYLYIDEDDRAAYPAGVAKFTNPYFETVYDRRGITIVRVR